LHSIGVVHGDLKLENIVIGHDDPSTIYLIDFGLSSQFMRTTEQGSSEHIEKKYIARFRGTYVYASNNACLGYN
jgi:serine/threonine protein kinase